MKDSVGHGMIPATKRKEWIFLKLCDKSRHELCAGGMAINPRELPTFIAVAFLLLVACLPAQGLAVETVVVRDRSGKAIEKRITRGNRTEIRSPSGRLLRVEIRKGKKIEVRDPSGRLLETETRIPD
jgi:hypothetical protein